MIVKGARQSAERYAAAQRKLELSNQRARFLKVSVILLCAVLVFMLAGNAGLTTAVVFLSKDTAVDNSGDHLPAAPRARSHIS